VFSRMCVNRVNLQFHVIKVFKMYKLQHSFGYFVFFLVQICSKVANIFMSMLKPSFKMSYICALLLDDYSSVGH